MKKQKTPNHKDLRVVTPEGSAHRVWAVVSEQLSCGPSTAYRAGAIQPLHPKQAHLGGSPAAPHTREWGKPTRRPSQPGCVRPHCSSEKDTDTTYFLKGLLGPSRRPTAACMGGGGAVRVAGSAAPGSQRCSPSVPGTSVGGAMVPTLVANRVDRPFRARPAPRGAPGQGAPCAQVQT